MATTVCFFAEEDQQHKLIVKRRTRDIPLQVVNSIRNASICGPPASASSWHASAFSAICIFKLLPSERQERRAGSRPSRRNQRAPPPSRHRRRFYPLRAPLSPWTAAARAGDTAGGRARGPSLLLGHATGVVVGMKMSSRGRFNLAHPNGPLMLGCPATPPAFGQMSGIQFLYPFMNVKARCTHYELRRTRALL